MLRYIGTLLKLTAVGHTLYGLLWFRHDLGQLLTPNMGLLQEQHAYPQEAVIFFFLLGPMLWLLGEALAEQFRSTGTVSRRVGLMLTVISLICCYLLPTSGPLLLLAQGALIVWCTRGGAPVRQPG